MRLFMALFGALMLAGSWVVCPDWVREKAMQAVTPSEAAEAGAVEMKRVVMRFIDSGPRDLDEPA